MLHSRFSKTHVDEHIVLVIGLKRNAGRVAKAQIGINARYGKSLLLLIYDPVALSEQIGADDAIDLQAFHDGVCLKIPDKSSLIQKVSISNGYRIYLRPIHLFPVVVTINDLSCADYFELMISLKLLRDTKRRTRVK